MALVAAIQASLASDEPATNQILALIGAKGRDLRMSDMAVIEMLTPLIPIEDSWEHLAWINEALSLIINDLSYEGDIQPIQ
ncbi:MAG: hypothetical protein EOP50_17570 [Sphingobacteriales bacterium]|nr:MAG: hypothetical protein EOP50_17570 [Sphingobacteriales bacterium]